MSNKHYIAMSGMSGCLPDTCESFESKDEAIDFLMDTFSGALDEAEQIDRKQDAIMRNCLIVHSFYSFTHPSIFGADYAEIVSCNCSNQESHNDL